MLFDVEITDLYGTTLATITQYSGLEVNMAVSEDRTAKLNISVYDPGAESLIVVDEDGEHVVAALRRMIRIKYRDETIFWGIVVEPKISTQRKQIELNCHGPTFKLKHRQLNYGDPIVSDDDAPPIKNPSDWTTMKKIVEAAYDTEDQYAENIPDIGVLVENISGEEAPSEFWTQIQRGANNWDMLIQVSESAYGGEFDVVPYDPTEDEIPFDTTLISPP